MHVGVHDRHVTQGIADAIAQPVVGGIEAHQGHEQPQIGFRQAIAE